LSRTTSRRGRTPCPLGPAQKVSLGQRRALVRKFSLVADQYDPATESLGTQRLNCLGPANEAPTITKAARQSRGKPPASRGPIPPQRTHVPGVRLPVWLVETLEPVAQEKVGRLLSDADEISPLRSLGSSSMPVIRPGRGRSARPARTGDTVRNSSSSMPSPTSCPRSRGPPSVRIVACPRKRIVVSTSAMRNCGPSPTASTVQVRGTCPLIRRSPAVVVATSAPCLSAGCSAGRSPLAVTTTSSGSAARRRVSRRSAKLAAAAGQTCSGSNGGWAWPAMCRHQLAQRRRKPRR